MMNVLENYTKALDGLREANRNVARAHLTFSETFRARLEDLSMIQSIHGWYVETASENSFGADGSANNKQFVFLILYLYSPASLVGGGINKTLRKAIASALGIKADTAVYKMRSNAVSWYKCYPRFRAECNTAIRETDVTLAAHGIGVA